MTADEASTVKQIRELGRGSRGKPPELWALGDATLHRVFFLLRNGCSNRSIARELKARFGLKSSENSVQQQVGKLRKRIAPLLRTVPPQEPVADISEIDRLPAEERLGRLMEIEKSYGDLIEEMLAAARDNDGLMTSDMAKHVKALSTIAKTRAQLESSGGQKNAGQPLGPGINVNLEFESKAALAHDWLTSGGDGEKMVRAATNFLAEIEKRCITVEQNEHGEWTKVKPKDALPR